MELTQTEVNIGKSVVFVLYRIEYHEVYKSAIVSADRFPNERDNDVKVCLKTIDDIMHEVRMEADIAVDAAELVKRAVVQNGG